MIRPESFTVSTEDFAAERRQVLTDIAADLRPHVADALNRLGLPSWEQQIVRAALDVFDQTARAEVDEWSPIIDDMRDLFAKELGETLVKTKTAANRDHQLDTITGWVSQMSHNAAMEAATTSDPNTEVGLEWVTMSDADVREPHQEAHGQQVPTGQEFEVGGEKMLYPGQPVGDPSNWINCRCVARPTMLGEMAGQAEDFAANVEPHLTEEYKQSLIKAYGHIPELGGFTRINSVNDVPREVALRLANKYGGFGHIPTEYVDDVTGTRYRFTGYEEFAPDPTALEQDEPEKQTSTAIVALPAADDPISAASSESSGAHATLLFLGDSSALDEAALKAGVEQFVTDGQVGIITESVNGRAVLGKDSADVVLFDAANLVYIREGLLGMPALAEAHASVEQFPTWLPHVTLGYPDTPALAEYDGAAITFDRLAVWHGESRTEYQLGETMPDEKKVAHAEDPEFTQEMADAFVAAVAPDEDEASVPAAPAEAPTPTEPEPEQFRAWHGVLAPEAALSGDQRQFMEKALTTRNLPLPLKAMFIDDQGHKGSVVVGRIDEIFRDKAGMIRANGVYDNSMEADRAWALVENRMWRGVSVDIDAAVGTVNKAEGEYGKDSVEFNEGRVCAATMCAIPAFAEAYVRNGTWEDFAGQPEPTGEMVTIPDWPQDIVKETEPAPVFSLTASAAVKEISADFFRNPGLSEPTPVTRGEDGHIFGHLAEWGSCHIGFSEVCVTAPPSVTDYSFFLTGQVFTDAGAVAVGQLTVGGGHAPDGVTLRAAIAHYDNVSTAVADVTVGEDSHGIWFSGRIRPWATEQQIHELFAAGPSGDWREAHARGMSSMELVAAHVVNVPGFAVRRPRFAVKDGRQTSLVAAGAIAPHPLSSEIVLEREAAVLATELRFMEFNHISQQFSTLEGK